MKNIIQYLTLILFASGMTVLSSCNKKSDDTTDTGTTGTSTTSAVPSGRLMFHLHTYVGSSEVDAYNIVYTSDEGRKIALSIAQFYISGIQLTRLDGTLFDIPGAKILKTLEGETYLIGEVPPGNYKSVRFKVGLDEATNQLSPSSSPDSAILNHPEMWFGNTAQPDGYVFFNTQGKIDTTSDASGTREEMQPFSYKVGTNAHLKQIIMPDKNFTVIPNQVTFVHILVDYSKLFNGISINRNSNLFIDLPSDNATDVGVLITNNLPAMFFYEE